MEQVTTSTKLQYYHNKDFKEYVDKYCISKHKDLDEALKDKIVLEYLVYLLNNH